ncbi:MAG: adenosylcobinamide-GDP ribazoletransferase [Dehalococcoidales bacterium]|nr:adenosylcobinamide-GDP ribazoletransferase [Dehalococcoidales bacterium]
MRFLAALRFLTIIPLPHWRETSTEEIGHSVVYFPVIGVVIGLILAGLNWLLGLFLPQAIVNVLLIVAMVIISGALHLDGFADTCDGMAGYKTVEDRLRVMHDSRVGAFGVIGVSLLLLVKYVSLSSVPGNLLPVTLVLMPVISRWAMVYAIFAYPYARPTGLGKAFKQKTNWQSFIMATIITPAIAIGLARLANIAHFYLMGLAIIVGIWIIIIAIAAYFQRKFTGLTGDTYGAINEVAEVGVLIMICLLTHNHWL